MYLFMINEYIIVVESISNSFHATCGFNTKARSLKGKVLMN
jgi:hypothetical protein